MNRSYDYVAGLRDHCVDDPLWAADEIERLRAENAELRERQRQVMRSAMGVYQRHGEPAPERERGDMSEANRGDDR